MFGRWTNGLYYRGVIDSKTALQVHVKFKDGDDIWSNLDDRRAVIPDVEPFFDGVFVGSRVIAYWPSASVHRYYPGTVARVNSSTYTFYVYYDDGDKGWVPLSKLRTLDTPGLFDQSSNFYIWLRTN